MNHFSYWEQKHFWKNWDFTIVGSGITGLTSAIFLKKRYPNASIVVLERGILPSGASTKNAGFACFGSASEILDDLKKSSEKEVFQLVADRYEGLALLKGLLGEGGIGYDPCGGYEVFMRGEEMAYEDCLGSLSYLNAEMVQVIGKQVFWDAGIEIENKGMRGISNMLINKDEGTIDTGLMMKNLIKMARNEGIEIINGIEVLSVDIENETPLVETKYGAIKSQKVVIATNGFAGELTPGAEVKPARAQVLITKPIENLRLEGCFHHDRGYNYFRSIDNRVLFGGGRQIDIETEGTTLMETTEKIQSYLENILREVILPEREVEIESRWSGIMGLGDSKKVIVDKIGPSAYRAVRFGGMGVALGSFAGKKLSEIVEF